jgi:hypothetical protein
MKFQQLAKIIEGFLNYFTLISFYGQIWLKPFINDGHFCYKFEGKTLLRACPPVAI